MPPSAPATLLEEAKRILAGRKFIVVSNREPYEHVRTAKGITVKRTIGGLTAALDPLLRALEGTWIAWGSGSADRDVTDRTDAVRVPPEEPAYRLRRVWLTEEEVRDYYEGHANQTLWPLCHAQTERLRFRRNEWDVYQQVNRRFAEAALEEAGGKPAVVWFQDYHLATAPMMLRQRAQEAIIAQFWHTPWPPWEIFRMHPQRRALLEGLLGCDLIGMHLDLFCRNFLECVQEEFGCPVNSDRQFVLLGDHTVRLRALPISIDAESFATLAASEEAARLIAAIRRTHRLGKGRIGIGIERSDYTKGILERLRALELFFELYPAWRKQLTFLQITSPSRERIPVYVSFAKEVQQAIQRINRRFGTAAWKPVVHLKTAQTTLQVAALERMADIAIVSSLHDGMNLVAKEFLAAQGEEPGALLLSEFAGAAEEMQQAIRINPYDVEGFAHAIHRALTMPREEKASRVRQMRAHLLTHTIYDWMADFLEGIAEVMPEHAAERVPLSLLSNLETVGRVLQRAPHIALFCDYDGVLTPIAPRPEDAHLDDATRDLLRKLRDSARVRVTVVSGRALADLTSLVAVERLTYAGNHGLEIEGPRARRKHPLATETHEAMTVLYDDLRPALRDFSGVIVENKRLSITVHYRLADPARIGDILTTCHDLVEARSGEGKLLRITTGKKVLEVRPNIDWDKGRAVLWILRTIYGDQWEKSALPVYIGDDETDEDAFRALGNRGITIRIGPAGPEGTAARFSLGSVDDVHLLLEWMTRLPAVPA